MKFRILNFLWCTWLVLPLLPVVISCSGQNQGTVTFAVGGAPAELDFWDSLIRRFEAQTGISVTLHRQPTDSDQRRQGLMIPLVAGMHDPDVFLMDVVWIAQFAASGWLEPLDRYMSASASLPTSDGPPQQSAISNRHFSITIQDFFPNVLDTADSYRGTLVALPVYVDGGILYYRKDLLEQIGVTRPPETWDQLVSYSLRVQEASPPSVSQFYGFVWQGAQYEGLVCNFLEFAGSNGGGISFGNEEIAVQTPQNLAAARFMVDLIHKWRISPPSTYIEMKEEQVRTAFQQGNALFERNWPYAFPLHESEGSQVRGKVGIAPLPHFPGGKSVSTLGGWHIGISRFSDCKDLSWKLVQFITSNQGQRELSIGLGWPPGRMGVYNDPAVVSDRPYFARLENVFESARPRPTLPYYTQLSEVLQRYLNAMLAGNLTPEQALSLSDRDTRKIISRYGKE